MNAKQIMDFADEHAYEPNMFNDLEQTLDEEKFNILVELESNPGDKKLNRQYTGLCDKNGRKIFEGDIIRIVGDSNNDDWKNVNYIAQIVYLDGGFCAIGGTLDDYSMRRYGLHRKEFDLEVIGNIIDNPEILEVVI